MHQLIVLVLECSDMFLVVLQMMHQADLRRLRYFEQHAEYQSRSRGNYDHEYNLHDEYKYDLAGPLFHPSHRYRHRVCAVLSGRLSAVAADGFVG